MSTTVKKQRTYTVGYFLKKFKSIPPSRWITGSLHRHKKNRRGKDVWMASCAMGHCERIGKGAGFALGEMFSDFGLDVVAVNDSGKYSERVQVNRVPKTPRARILKALRFINRSTKGKARVKATV